MTVVRPPARIAIGAFTFAVVFVAFVASMRSCAKAIWPTQIASVSAFDTLRALALAHRNGVR